MKTEKKHIHNWVLVVSEKTISKYEHDGATFNYPKRVDTVERVLVILKCVECGEINKTVLNGDWLE